MRMRGRPGAMRRRATSRLASGGEFDVFARLGRRGLDLGYAVGEQIGLTPQFTGPRSAFGQPPAASPPAPIRRHVSGEVQPRRIGRTRPAARPDG